ncbi:abc transporter [Emericellopsis atlantica]|uniref:Abc transporter n=1 Tax=Emericellopsis atlantica TaxID=2614577 RepID=A0A9P7ZDU9_9HYPO|nr:abc transporter [Emericellopsis atlantica]KAG9250313.1 abc transporter [Emericellopsis atlantica]
MVAWSAILVKKTHLHPVKDEEETRGLLNGRDSGEGSDDGDGPAEYGSINQQTSGHEEEDEEDDDEDEDEKEIKRLQKQRMAEQGGWVGYLRGFAIFLPYIVPYRDRHAQLWVFIMLVCVSLERVLIVMIPQQLSAVTDSLAATAVTGHVPWATIIAWGLLRFPGSGMTHMLKTMANTRISQFAYSQLKSASFAHVMGLSMDYHTTKSSGKLVKAIEQGTDLTSIIENAFTIGPMLIDIAIAAVYLTTRFDFYMGYILLTTSLLHIYSNVKTISRTVPIERISSERARVENEVLYDSVTNWPTVAYHNRRTFEQERYARVVRSHVTAERRYYDWIDYGEALREFVLDTGLVLAAALAAYRISTGDAQVSSFVFLVVYWAEIREPMSQLAWTFRETSAHLINAEWLFQLLQNKPTVQDKPDARELVVKEGRVDFDRVSFAYDPQRPILRDVSFTALPGQSVALVGETGGGKSTVLKLLYRFYDVQGGSIAIDGLDVRDVTLDSLRDNLGIVPQDPSVFDQTIMDNVRYAHPHATPADVVAACKAAQIHDQIMSFPDAYGTRLGERGVRLSGGELQRVAIARVLLRRPRIVVLDEATSAVDSRTEASVQQALRALGAGRTVFTVAHRLSTVVDADLILVMDKGAVVERGTHGELLAIGGRYTRLWEMQTAHSRVEDD